MPSFLQIPVDRSLVFDLLLVLVAAYLLISSVRKGSAATFFSLFSLCLAYPVSCYLFPLLASFFPLPVKERILVDAIAFAALMGTVYFLILLATWVMLALLKRVLPDVADQIAAAALGLLRTAVMIVFITLIAVTFLPPGSSFIKNSFAARSLLFAVNTIVPPFPPALKEKFLAKRGDLGSVRGRSSQKK